MPLVVPRCVITTTSELGMSNLYSSAVYVLFVTSVLAALLEAISCCLSCASPLGPMASTLSPIILSSLAASPPASPHSLSSAIKAFCTSAGDFFGSAGAIPPPNREQQKNNIDTTHNPRNNFPFVRSPICDLNRQDFDKIHSTHS